MLSAVALVAGGLLLVLLGLWGGLRRRSPVGALLAWGAPLGLLMTLTGVVQLVIRRFFA